MRKLRAVIDWSHVGLTTAGWGTLSCSIGAVTPGNRFSQWCMHRWCISMCDRLRMDRELHNGHLLDQVPQCVYVANHLSLLDIPLIGSFLSSDYRWLAKEQIFQVPFLGWHLGLAGHIRVHRKDKTRNRELPARIHAAVRAGGSLLFFPEGTRSEDGTLQPFKIGAFRTAVDEDLPVVPLVIRGTDQLLRKGAGDIAVERDHAARRCTLTLLPVIHPTPVGDPKDRAEALRRHAHEAIHAELYGAAATAPERPAAHEARSAAAR